MDTDLERSLGYQDEAAEHEERVEMGHAAEDDKGHLHKERCVVRMVAEEFDVETIAGKAAAPWDIEIP